MNTPNQPKSDMLDRAVEALRTVPTLDRPPSSCVASTLAALNSQPTLAVPSLNQQRRQRMFRIARYSSLAAALLLAVVGLSMTLFLDRGASPAFGQVIEKVKTAKSVTFSSIQKFGPQPALELKFYLQGDQMRVEIPGKQQAFDAGMPIVQAYIANLRTKSLWDINYSTKIVKKSTVDEKSAKPFVNPIEGFRDLTENDAELVGEEQLSGRKTQVYRIKKLHGLLGIQGDVDKGEGSKAWIDPQSGLPVKIAIDVSFLAAGEKWNENASSLVFEDFKWNQELDKQLFEPQIPEGFKVSDGKGVAPVDKTRSKETESFPFSQVVERMKKLTSVQFSGEEFGIDQPRSVFVHKYSVQGHRIRDEIVYPDNAPQAPQRFVLIIDTDAKQVLHLTYPQKSASKYPVLNTTSSSFLDNPSEAFASLRDDDARLLGFEVLDDEITCVYELNKYPFRADAALKKGESTKIWVDPQTNLPVQLLIHMVSPEGHVTAFRAKDIKWNAPIDPKLLEMEIPEGFKVVQSKSAMSPLPFAAVLESLSHLSSVSFERRSTSLVRKYLIQQPRLRTEWWRPNEYAAGDPPEEATIVNFDTHDVVNVNYRHRFANRFKVVNPISEYNANLLDYLRKLSEKDATFAGESTLADGAKTYEFELKHFIADFAHEPEGGPAILAVDRATKLPLRIQTNHSDPQRAEIVYDHFTWNKPIDAKQFDLEIPSDFTISGSPPEQSK